MLMAACAQVETRYHTKQNYFLKALFSGNTLHGVEHSSRFDFCAGNRTQCTVWIFLYLIHSPFIPSTFPSGASEIF